MKIDFPVPNQYPQLENLWKEAFGDTEEFIDGFFCTGFSPSRCRCVMEDEKILAALYWLDALCEGQRLAYVYAVATADSHRGKGLCKALMADTHAHLKLRGYEGVLLVPQTAELRQMYEAMGYRTCTTVSEFTCEAGTEPLTLHRIDRDEYAALRRQFLPDGGAVQEEESISYLETMAFFYQGDGFLAAALPENGVLRCAELLGDVAAAPGLLAALRCRTGSFRIPGDGKDFAMFLPLEETAKPPKYLGLAFD